MAYPDHEAADKIVRETLRAAGFVYTDRHGEEQIDGRALEEAVYRTMVEDHVVENPKDMTKGAATRHELYAEVFPNGPGATAQPRSEEETLARDELRRKVWNLTNTGPTGSVNKRVEEEGLTLVMCEAPVARTILNVETGRTEPTTVPGRFLTDHAELIANYSTAPRALKLVKVAEGVAKHVTMVVRRHPELTATVAHQIRGAVRQSQATLGAVTNSKPALGPSQSEPEFA